MTLQEFIDKHCVELRSIRVNQNPNMVDQSWKADHYEVTLTFWNLTNSGPNRPASFTTYYSKGLGHKGKPPKSTEVLESLILDCDVVGQSFKDWADSLGYNHDSISDLKLYYNCTNVVTKLKNTLGREVFNKLMGVERE